MKSIRAHKNVSLSTTEELSKRGFGGCCGKLAISIEGFANMFGNPHEVYDPNDGDGKVTVQWFFTTPRGIVSVHDYWWNGPGTLSIGNRSGGFGSTRLAGDRRAELWARRFFRESGIKTVEFQR